MSNVTPLRPRHRPTDPFAFDAASVVFNWTNEEWVRGNLWPIRLAVAIANKNAAEVEKGVSAMLADPSDDDLCGRLLADFGEVKDHLGALIAVLGSAEARLLLTLDRLGVSP